MTKEQLFELAIQSMPPGKTSFQWEYASPELKQEFRKRYKDLSVAKNQIMAWHRFRRCKEQWPVGWWEHVDPEPFFQRRGEYLSEQDRALLLRACEEARSTHQIPELTPKEKNRINSMGALGKVLAEIGIPYISNPSTLRKMTAYWSAGEKQKNEPTKP